MRAHFLQKIFLFLLVHNSEFLENLIKNYCIRPHLMWSSAEWVKPCRTHAVPVTYGAWGALQCTLSKPYPCQTGLEACHCDAIAMWSVPKQNVPYLDGRLNANPNRAPLVCNASHPGVGCEAYRMRTSKVRFRMLSTKELERSHLANHPGTLHSGVAQHGTIGFASKSAWTQPEMQGWEFWSRLAVYPLILKRRLHWAPLRL